jgi:hypothetical protein
VILWCLSKFIKLFVDGKYSLECRILKPLGDGRWMAPLVRYQLEKETGLMRCGLREIMLDVPREAFRYVDLPYSRDHHNFDSFRHPMMISDELFPETWKNLK